jgi:hypothetical protein
MVTLFAIVTVHGAEMVMGQFEGVVRKVEFKVVSVVIKDIFDKIEK